MNEPPRETGAAFLGGKEMSKFDKEQLYYWIKSHPPSLALSMVARTALRALPAVRKLARVQQPKTFGELLGVTFRANAAILRCAHGAVSNAQTADFIVAARSAGVSTHFMDPDVAVHAASTAAYLASRLMGASDESNFNLDEYREAAKLLELVLRERPMDHAAHANDCELIDRGLSPRALVLTPLWPSGRVPEKSFDDWKKLKELVVPLDLGFNHWLDWYERRIEGNQYNLQAETQRFLIPPHLNKKGIGTINEYIRVQVLQRNAAWPETGGWPNPADAIDDTVPYTHSGFDDGQPLFGQNTNETSTTQVTVHEKLTQTPNNFQSWPGNQRTNSSAAEFPQNFQSWENALPSDLSIPAALPGGIRFQASTPDAPLRAAKANTNPLANTDAQSVLYARIRADAIRLRTSTFASNSPTAIEATQALDDLIHCMGATLPEHDSQLELLWIAIEDVQLADRKNRRRAKAPDPDHPPLEIGPTAELDALTSRLRRFKDRDANLNALDVPSAELMPTAETVAHAARVIAALLAEQRTHLPGEAMVELRTVEIVGEALKTEAETMVEGVVREPERVTAKQNMGRTINFQSRDCPNSASP
jgi:hypothetical protein